MNTKTLMKVVAAIAIVCLPFIASSCSKDDDNGPVTYDYNWDITGFTIPNDNDSLATAWMAARSEVNKLVAKAIAAQGFDVNANAKTFKIEVDKDAKVSVYDEKVESAILSVKATSAFQAQAEKLPESAKIVVNRGKTNVVNRSLR